MLKRSYLLEILKRAGLLKSHFMATIDFLQNLSVLRTMHWLLYDEILDCQVMRFLQNTCYKWVG